MIARYCTGGSNFDDGVGCVAHDHKILHKRVLFKTLVLIVLAISSIMI
jgi:hypothetical protein